MGQHGMGQTRTLKRKTQRAEVVLRLKSDRRRENIPLGVKSFRQIRLVQFDRAVRAVRVVRVVRAGWLE